MTDRTSAGRSDGQVGQRVLVVEDSFLSAEALAAMLRELGYEVATFLRTPDQLGRVLESAAMPEGDGEFEGSYVVFLREAASEAQKAALADLESDTDRFLFAGAEVFWHTRGKLSESPLFGKGIDGALGGEPSTLRNVNTLRRIAEKIGTIP